MGVVALSLLLYLFIQRTGYGLKIRALASDSALAQVSGIRQTGSHNIAWSNLHVLHFDRLLIIQTDHMQGL